MFLNGMVPGIGSDVGAPVCCGVWVDKVVRIGVTDIMVHKTSFFSSHHAAGSLDEPGAKAIAEIGRVFTRLQQVHKNNPTPANEKALQTVQTLLQGVQAVLDETPVSEASPS